MRAYEQANLYLMDADGSNPREIAADFPLEFGSLAWAPDGKSLLALCEDHGVLSVYNVSLSGKVSQVVTNVGGAPSGAPMPTAASRSAKAASR